MSGVAGSRPCRTAKASPGRLSAPKARVEGPWVLQRHPALVGDGDDLLQPGPDRPQRVGVARRAADRLQPGRRRQATGERARRRLGSAQLADGPAERLGARHEAVEVGVVLQEVLRGHHDLAVLDPQLEAQRPVDGEQLAHRPVEQGGDGGLVGVPADIGHPLLVDRALRPQAAQGAALVAARDAQAADRGEVRGADAGDGVGHLQVAAAGARDQREPREIAGELCQAAAVAADGPPAVDVASLVGRVEPDLVAEDAVAAAGPGAAHDVEEHVFAPRAGDPQIPGLGAAVAEAQAAPFRPSAQVGGGLPTLGVGREVAWIARGGAPGAGARGRRLPQQLEQLVGVGVAFEVRARDGDAVGAGDLQRGALRLRALGQIGQADAAAWPGALLTAMDPHHVGPCLVGRPGQGLEGHDALGGDGEDEVARQRLGAPRPRQLDERRAGDHRGHAGRPALSQLAGGDDLVVQPAAAVQRVLQRTRCAGADRQVPEASHQAAADTVATRPRSCASCSLCTHQLRFGRGEPGAIAIGSGEGVHGDDPSCARRAGTGRSPPHVGGHPTDRRRRDRCAATRRRAPARASRTAARASPRGPRSGPCGSAMAG